MNRRRVFAALRTDTHIRVDSRSCLPQGGNLVGAIAGIGVSIGKSVETLLSAEPPVTPHTVPTE
jgi:hypothetical protein